MVKKIFIVFLVLFLICVLPYSSNASDTQNKLDVVKKTAETTLLSDSIGFFDNKILSTDGQKVNLELTLNNSSSNQSDEQQYYDNTEIFIIIPEGLKEETKNTYINYVETFANKVFEANDKTKIGIVGMNGTISDMDENHMVTDKDEGDVPGSLDDAEILVMPTNNVTDIVSSINNMNPEKNNYHYNLQVAIRIAKNNFSNNVNKILISLYDNVPGIVIGVKHIVNYGGWLGTTAEQAVIQQHQRLVQDTKSEILSLKDKNIKFILFRPDDTSFDQTWYSTSTGELILNFDGSPYVEDLYGTIENPTYGKMYSLDDSNLEQVVTENIYNDVIEEVGSSISNINIKYTFAQEILDNFNISFDDSSNVNTDTLATDGYFTWNIDKLDVSQSATLKYSIQLKDSNNSQLLEKTFPVSKQVSITYDDINTKSNTVTSSDSPTLKLSKYEIEEKPDPGNTEIGNNEQSVNTEINNNEKPQNTLDNTTAPGTLPQTGLSPILFILITLAIVGTIFIIRRNNYYKDIK